MKARLIFTYIIVILISVVVLKSYIMSAMSASLYNDNRVNMVTKINIIATDISGVPEEEIAKAMNEDLAQLSIGKDNRIIVTNSDAFVIYDNTPNVY